MAGPGRAQHGRGGVDAGAGAGHGALLATPTGHVWPFAAAALLLGAGNQAWPAAHAALVATVAHGRERDAALAGGRALRNAGLGAGALVATACLAGGATALVTVLAPAHLLGRALARFELSTGLGLAVSPAVITALAPHGPAALWGGLAGATLLSARAVAAEKDRGTPSGGPARSDDAAPGRERVVR